MRLIPDTLYPGLDQKIDGYIVLILSMNVLLIGILISHQINIVMQNVSKYGQFWRLWIIILGILLILIGTTGILFITLDIYKNGALSIKSIKHIIAKRKDIRVYDIYRTPEYPNSIVFLLSPGWIRRAIKVVIPEEVGEKVVNAYLNSKETPMVSCIRDKIVLSANHLTTSCLSFSFASIAPPLCSRSLSIS